MSFPLDSNTNLAIQIDALKRELLRLENKISNQGRPQASGPQVTPYDPLAIPSLKQQVADLSAQVKRLTNQTQANGTVTSFDAGDMLPLFTTEVDAPNNNPLLRFAGVEQAKNAFFVGPITGADAIPDFRAIDAADLGTGTADATKFLRGDLSWSAPSWTLATPTTAYVVPGAYYRVDGDASAGGFTVTLPSSASYLGQLVAVSKSDASGNAVTVAAAGGDTLFAVSGALAAQFDSLLLIAIVGGWGKV